MENAQLKSLKPIDGALNLDLKDLEQLNSIGTRLWIKHLNEYPDAKITFFNCSNIFLDTASILIQILGRGGADNIHSGALFFECEHCPCERKKFVPFTKVNSEVKREELIFDCPGCGLHAFKIQDSAFVHILEDNGFN